MRPVEKAEWAMANGIRKSYKPHTIAKGDLEDNLGCYCSYCEVFSSDLEVEHVVSRYQDPALQNDWYNFLLACGRCNGKDNKSNKPVDPAVLDFPHFKNTMRSFVYLEGGLVTVNPSLHAGEKQSALNMMKLVGLDKRPGNADYKKHNNNDTRWNHRRIAWEWAKKYLPRYEAHELTAQQIADFALQKGFFSVWFTVYQAYPEVKKKLVECFTGTAAECFDKINYDPVVRPVK